MCRLSPSGGQSRQRSQASCMSELRKREIATQQATRLRQIAQLELAAAKAEAAEFEAQAAEEIARAASSQAPSSKFHAGNEDTEEADKQLLPLQYNRDWDGRSPSSSHDRPGIAPHSQQMQTTASMNEPPAAIHSSKGNGRPGTRSLPLPLPGLALSSHVPDS